MLQIKQQKLLLVVRTTSGRLVSEIIDKLILKKNPKKRSAEQVKSTDNATACILAIH